MMNTIQNNKLSKTFLMGIFLLSCLFLFSLPQPVHAQGKTIMVIAPHPDDEALCCAGIISSALAQGNTVKVVVFTNGDNYTNPASQSYGYTREAETVAAMAALGVTEQNIIFLGYGDQDTMVLYQSASTTQVYTSPAGQTQTYGNRGLGGMDYHRFLTGSSAPYNQESALSDFKALLTNFHPDEIYTTSYWDNHPDHEATNGFTVQALIALKKQGLLPSTRVHEMVVHAPCEYCVANYNWPQTVFTPTLPYDPIPTLDQTSYLWSQTEHVLVPASMQGTNQSTNLKALAISSYVSQGGSDPSNWLFDYVKKEEYFWIRNFPTNVALYATATASSEAGGQPAAKAIDGVINGYPGSNGYGSSEEWSSNGELAGAWINLAWATPVTINEVILYDRPNLVDNVLSGTLTFSDGSSISVGALPPNGNGLPITFTAKTITSMKFTITGAQGENIGLSEIEAFGTVSGDTNAYPPQITQGPISSATTIYPTQKAHPSVNAFSAQGNSLTYSWSADGGTFTGAGSGVTYNPPTVASPTVYTVTSTIADGHGGSSVNNGFITVVPAGTVFISSFALNPNSVLGGATSTCTVTLSAAAPAGGAVVNLWSDNTLAATVPSSVTVPAGATTTTFTVSTLPVSTQVVLTIFGSYNNSTQGAMLTVGQLAVSLNPTIVTGGATSTGTITLGSLAPTGGAVVTLLSTNPSAASVPVSVTVPAGTSTTTFTVSSHTVSTPQTLTISGFYNGSQGATLIVNPPPATVTSLSAIPTTVNGAGSSTGTVTLSGSAPFGGAVVDLLSGDTSTATVPASVTVAAGASSATFTITTLFVNSSTNVTISGTYNSTTQGGTLTVNPPALLSVTLNPTSVTGGVSSTGTVTLNAAAPPGGAVVTLLSGNTSVATVPASVTVSAGTTSKTFTVTTLTVASSTNVTISGTYNGTLSATVTVTPPFITSVTLNPIIVTGGSTDAGTVTLSGPAPTGGALVTLLSSNTSAATVPASVTVAAGATSAPFTIATTVVTVPVTVTISGTYQGTQSAPLIVSNFAPIEVNSGGPAYTDPQGFIWSADAGFTGGSTGSTTGTITGTTTPTLYQTERFGTFSYSFTVPTGTYAVTLKFAEIYWTQVGERVFNVAINGTTVLPNFDILAVAGGINKAIDQTFMVNSTGTITVQFTNGSADVPKISAIRIAAPSGVGIHMTPTAASLIAGQQQQLTATVTGTANTAVAWTMSPQVGTLSATGLYTAPATVTTQQVVTVTATAMADSTQTASAQMTLLPPFAAIRLNSGGPAYTDPQANVWSADNGFLGGSASSTNATITNTTTPTLYQTERYGTFGYNFAVPTGNYVVTLKFAEIYFTATGLRKFNVAINGTTVLSNFDIVAAAGGANKAIDQAFTINSTGTINIQFTNGSADQPKISAIQISPLSVQVSPTTINLSQGQQQQFTASIGGVSSNAVTWTMSPQVGTLSATGLYTAPAAITTQQVVNVTATSTTDTTQTATAQATLIPPDFSIAASPSSQSVVQGSGTSYTATVTSLGNFAAAVNFSVSGLPTGAIGTFTPTSVSGSGSSTLNVTTATTTAVGSYTVTITGTSGTLVHTTTATFQVTPLIPDFSIAALPSSQSIVQGSGTSYTGTVTPVNGFTGVVTFSVSGLPTGANGTFTPTTVTASGSSTLNVTTSTTTPAGSYTISIIGTSGTLVHITTVALVVNTLTGSFTPIRVNVGGPAYTDPLANVWSADTGFTGGNAASSNATITNTTTPTLYQTERYGAFSYNFAAPAGTYAVTLKFAEIYYTTPGQRIFNVSINGTPVLTNFDIVAAAGAAFKAYDQTFTVNSTGTIMIQFITGSADLPKLSALQITNASGVSVQVSPTTASLTGGQQQQFTSTVTGSANTAVTWTMNPAVGTLSATGLYTAPAPITAQQVVTVTATSAADTTQTASAHVTLVPPDFSIAALPSSQSVLQGNGTSYTATVTPSNGFSGVATFSVSGLPTGASGTFTPTSVTGSGSSTLNVTTSTTTPTGTYTVTITGTSGTLVHTTTVTLQVTSLTPDFGIAASPSSQSIVQSGGTSFTATVAPSNGFSGVVTFSASGLPTGASGAFTPTTVTGSGSSTLNVTTASTTPVGSYTVSITGTSGALVHTTTVTLVVNPLVIFTPIHVNTGGPAYTDPLNNIWSADTGFTGGSTGTTGSTITGTTTPTLYQSERYGAFSYNFAAPAGTYAVTLKFAEIYYTTTGKRIFNVAINGATVLTNFDIVAAAGAAFKAVDQTFTVNSTGAITIQFITGSADLPKLSALQITNASGVSVQVSPPSASLSGGQQQQFTSTVTGSANTAVTWTMSPAVGTLSATGLYTAPATITTQQVVTVTATSAADATASASATITLLPPFAGIFVNSGGSAYTDPLANVWLADTGFSGGSTGSTAATITNTTTPTLYQSERYGAFSYTFAVPNGSHTVILKFAEIYYTTPGQRIFSVAINGTTVASNLDIVQQAGGADKALDLSYPITVSGGSITIQFIAGSADLPKVSAIQIQ